MVCNEWTSRFLFIGRPPWKVKLLYYLKVVRTARIWAKGTSEKMNNWTGSVQSKPAAAQCSGSFPLFHSVNIYWPSSMYQALCWALEIQPVKPPAPRRMARLPRLDLLLPSPMPSIFGSVKISTFCYHTLWLLHQLCWGYWLAKAFIIPQSHSSLDESSRLGLKCFWFPQLQTLSQILTLMEFILSALIF